MTRGLVSIPDRELVMMKKGFFLLFSGVALVCTGCAQIAIPKSSRNVSTDVVEGKLIEAAQSVSTSLADLAAIESASMPPSSLPKPKNAEFLGLSARASINWTGPIEPLVRKLAKTAHFSVHVLGVQPAMPTIVSVKAEDASLATILRNARYQALKAAEIEVYPNTKIIEIRFRDH